MKTILVLGLLTLLVSCGKDSTSGPLGFPSTPTSASDTSSPSVSTSESDETIVTQPTAPSDLTLVASRDYTPTKFNNFANTIKVATTYIVPSEVEVIQGNSGTGWLSLIVGNRKFCYQGNASNNNTFNGTKFVIKWEKTSPSEDCPSNQFKTTFNSEVNVQIDDELKLSVNGGGCSNRYNTCVYTEVEMELVVK